MAEAHEADRINAPRDALERQECELYLVVLCSFFFFFQAEDGIRDLTVTGVQTCALPILGAFVAASALCAAAPTIQLLVAARFVQGVGGALLTPGSLAIIDAVFHPDDRRSEERRVGKECRSRGSPYH